ncbi:MAG: DUF616 domain-containing protein [Acidobacteriota bacterium]|nr:DUF616 domain-containing protein [Acidobacteriota bacterium]
MKEIIENLEKSVAHIKALNDFFSDVANYNLPNEQKDFDLYQQNLQGVTDSFIPINLAAELYNPKSRQMILADLFEYALLGRGFYSIGGTKRQNISKKENFAKGILHLVNLLMNYESLTVNTDRRNRFLDFLSSNVEGLDKEDGFDELRNYIGNVGTPNSNEGKKIGNYFDKLLPKTAGGLWHELLVYIFILRHDLGFVLPLLLHQKIYSKLDHLVPPDFLLLTKDKRVFGIEVGRKKEIQSGTFSLKTAIPTASLDTENSRNSDRCPICLKWINFCPYVIEKFSNFSEEISRKCEVKCVRECTVFSEEQIINGECKFSKYARNKAQTMLHTHHIYSNNYHYHYSCVLEKVDENKRQEIIAGRDVAAIKTHMPYYSGLEELEKYNDSQVLVNNPTTEDFFDELEKLDGTQ